MNLSMSLKFPKKSFQLVGFILASSNFFFDSSMASMSLSMPMRKIPFSPFRAPIVCPALPRVPSMTTSPGERSRPSIVSCKRTGSCMLYHANLAQFFGQSAGFAFNAFFVARPGFLVPNFHARLDADHGDLALEICPILEEVRNQNATDRINIRFNRSAEHESTEASAVGLTDGSLRQFCGNFFPLARHKHKQTMIEAGRNYHFL